MPSRWIGMAPETPSLIGPTRLCSRSQARNTSTSRLCTTRPKKITDTQQKMHSTHLTWHTSATSAPALPAVTHTFFTRGGQWFSFFRNEETQTGIRFVRWQVAGSLHHYLYIKMNRHRSTRAYVTASMPGCTPDPRVGPETEKSGVKSTLRLSIRRWNRNIPTKSRSVRYGRDLMILGHPGV